MRNKKTGKTDMDCLQKAIFCHGTDLKGELNLRLINDCDSIQGTILWVEMIMVGDIEIPAKKSSFKHFLCEIFQRLRKRLHLSAADNY